MSTAPQPERARPSAHVAGSENPEHDIVAEDGVSEEDARAITDLLVRVADLSLGSGASAARVETLVRRVANAYHLRVQLDVTHNRIEISYEPMLQGNPITVMHSINPDHVDHDRLERVEHLVADIQGEHLALATARARVLHIQASPFRARRWMHLLSALVLGAAIAAMLGGHGIDMAVSALSTLLVDELRRRLEPFALGAFLETAACAAVPTALAMLTLVAQHAAPGHLRHVSPALVIAAGMVSLLAGTGIVAAANDAIDGNYISSAARTVEVVVTTGGIVAGLIVTMWLAARMGAGTQLEPSPGRTTAALVQVLASGLIAFGIGVRCNMRWRALSVTTVLGLVLWCCWLAAAWITPSRAGRVVVAALVVGALGRLANHRLRIPLVALSSTAIASLMPGMMLYRGVFALGGDEPTTGAWLLLGSAYSAVALATGTSLGAMVVGILLHLRHPEEAGNSLALAEAAHG